MKAFVEIIYLEIEENEKYKYIIQPVLKTCFETEHLTDANLYISVTLTNSKTIQAVNKKYRNIDRATDVLSFPMFTKEELKDRIENKKNMVEDVLGDIMISIPKVEEQAKEYGHGFERELAYMVVHGFYHVMGYDHMEEADKKEMRQKEEKVLNQLNIKRGCINE